MTTLGYEFSESVRIAFAQILANKMRSLLTALGVIIGIVAVTLMGTAINGIDVSFQNSLAILGDETRHRPAELGHAGGELRHLIVIMGLWIGGIGRQLGQRPGLDPLGGEAQRHEGRVSRFVDAARGPDPGLHAGSSGHDARSEKAAVCRGLQRLALRRRVAWLPKNRP